MGFGEAGKARRGLLWQAWLGVIRSGVVWCGMVWQAKSQKSERSFEMVYEWKKASYIKTDANIAGQMCEKLENSVGLSAKTLLDANRQEDAPLHNEFEWDNEKAAEGFRLSQARHIINCLCVKAEESPTKEPIRAFFKLEKQESEYKSLDVILQNEDSYEELMKAALAELRAFEKKYKALESLAGIFDEIKKLTA